MYQIAKVLLAVTMTLVAGFMGDLAPSLALSWI
jgi:hypothetical protein